VLDTVITVDNLKQHAGSTIFRRGQAYFAQGAVGEESLVAGH